MNTKKGGKGTSKTPLLFEKFVKFSIRLHWTKDRNSLFLMCKCWPAGNDLKDCWWWVLSLNWKSSVIYANCLRPAQGKHCCSGPAVNLAVFLFYLPIYLSNFAFFIHLAFSPPLTYILLFLPKLYGISFS